MISDKDFIELARYLDRRELLLTDRVASLVEARSGHLKREVRELIQREMRATQALARRSSKK